MLEKVEKEEIEERRAHDLSLIQEMQTPHTPSEVDIKQIDFNIEINTTPIVLFAYSLLIIY